MTRILKMAHMLGFTGAVLATLVRAGSAVEISDIEIRSEAAVIADNEATTYWPNLDNDLKNALIEELAGDSSESGVVMQVTVRELSVAEHASPTSDDGTLSTTIMFIAGGQAAGSLEHTISVNQEGEDGVFTDRIVLPRSSDEFYQALVSHYAKTAAQKVRDVN